MNLIVLFHFFEAKALEQIFLSLKNGPFLVKERKKDARVDPSFFDRRTSISKDQTLPHHRYGASGKRRF
jgi:hypothetical protein